MPVKRLAQSHHAAGGVERYFLVRPPFFRNGGGDGERSGADAAGYRHRVNGAGVTARDEEVLSRRADKLQRQRDVDRQVDRRGGKGVAADDGDGVVVVFRIKRGGERQNAGGVNAVVRRRIARRRRQTVGVTADAAGEGDGKNRGVGDRHQRRVLRRQIVVIAVDSDIADRDDGHDHLAGRQNVVICLVGRVGRADGHRARRPGANRRGEAQHIAVRAS